MAQDKATLSGIGIRSYAFWQRPETVDGWLVGSLCVGAPNDEKKITQ
jgi:hypothetical protein